MAEQSMTATPASVTLTQEQLNQLLQAAAASAGRSNGGFTPEDLAKAFAATQKKENTQAPMVSVYNPRGETDHPKPALRAKTLQNGIELDHDTLTWEEIEALNALPAGEFRVTKANGNKVTFTVRLVRGMDGTTVERVEIHYPSKDEHRYDHRGLWDYSLEVIEAAGLKDALARLTALRTTLNAERMAAKVA